MSQFVHLRVHSEYSVIDSTLKVKSAIKLASESQQPALALTDQTNMFALVKFYTAAMGAGVKPIIGSDIWVEPDLEKNKKAMLDKPFWQRNRI
jgi:DNA polymerase-3 subunit alpha